MMVELTKQIRARLELQAASMTRSTNSLDRDAGDALLALLSHTPDWQPVTGPGQVQVGDKIRFNIGDRQFKETVKKVLRPGTDREEAIYKLKKNFYFITSMVVDGTSNHKNVRFWRKPS